MKNVIYCPHSVHNSNKPKRILTIIDKEGMYLYCNDIDCVKERKGTWVKLEMSFMGEKIPFNRVNIKLSEMPVGCHFDLDKNFPLTLEMSNA